MVAMSALPESPLAKRVPGVGRRTGNLAIDLQAQHQRDAYIDVVHGFWHYPDIRIAVRDFMVDLIADKKKRETQGADTLASASMLGSIDELERVSLVAKHSSLSVKKLGELKTADPKSLSHLVMYVLNSSTSVALPQELSNRKALALAWDNRVKECGDRLKNISDDMVGGNDNIINWAKLGVYQFEFVDGKAARVIHRPTNAIARVNADLNITETFEIHFNWADLNAVVVKGAAKFKCCDMSPKGQGPFAVKHCSGKLGAAVWKRLAAAACEILAAQTKQEPGTYETADADEYYTPSKDKRVEATKRAREVLARREAECATKRRFSIKSMP